MRILISCTLVLLCLLINIPCFAGPALGEVSFKWDANTEEDLGGYKIKYGRRSRFDSSLDHAAIYQSVKDKYCEGQLGKLLEDCIKSVDDFCTDPADKLCDFDFFEYEGEIDVKNVLEYTVKSLLDGTYYFTPIAYDTDKNESKYGAEIKVVIDKTAPGVVVNFSSIVKESTTYTITIDKVEKNEKPKD